MQIVMFSDTHSKHEHLILPDGDLLIFGGDMSMVGSLSDCISFIKWFKKQPHKHKIFIAGNHDWIFDVDSHHREMLLDYSSGCHYLENETIELDGVTIYGSPYTPRYGDWAFMRYSDGMGKVWETIPNKVDIIITHTPIHGILDLTYEYLNAGCKNLKERLENVDYKLHVCGHIHEAYGYEKLDGKHHINASINKSTGIPNKPIVLDFNKL
jgi:Icc-related predicted phosphoesterase